ncbi:hypothetical protein D0499_05520 [Weissella soli]|uniref:PH domain-containing protein n=1 Tax=Weissella soli TaxID=155866 RepID=UPI0021BEE237|nr:PH domain-containing protein [Weissella soli]MCT8395269.1 hypothetical protein [Weissella soli]
MSNKIDGQRLEEIYQQMIDAGVSDSISTKKEVKQLPALLRGAEKILYAVPGTFEKVTVLAVVTDQRLIFVKHGAFGGSDFREIAIEKIDSVSYSNGLLSSKIAVENAANTTMIENINKKTAPKFVEILKSAIDDLNNSTKLDQSTTADELLKLKSLLDAGVLTQDEFDIQKEKLLD